MKIQLLSDTHHSPYNLAPDADLIVHAGDFGNGIGGVKEFIETCHKFNKPYVFVLGNHDLYHENISHVYAEIKRLKLNCLFENQVFEFGGWTFVGGTLFSNFRENRESYRQFMRNKETAEYNVADFRYIFDYQENSVLEKRITGNDYRRFFNQQLDWINQFRHQPKTVILTHFPPSIICEDQQYSGSPLNPYFINDIEVTGFKYWFAGHTHSAMDKVYQDCRIIINPLGYPNEQGKNGFRENLLIELE